MTTVRVVWPGTDTRVYVRELCLVRGDAKEMVLEMQTPGSRERIGISAHAHDNLLIEDRVSKVLVKLDKTFSGLLGVENRAGQELFEAWFLRVGPDIVLIRR